MLQYLILWVIKLFLEKVSVNEIYDNYICISLIHV